MLAFRSITLLTASVSILGLLAIPSEASAGELILCGEGDVRVSNPEVMNGSTFTYEISLKDTIDNGGVGTSAFFAGAVTSFKVDSVELVLSPNNVRGNDVNYNDLDTEYRFNIFAESGVGVQLIGYLPANYFGAGPYTISQLEELTFGDFTAPPEIAVKYVSATAYGDVTTLEICSAPAYQCTGFEPPLADGSVTVKKNRVLPLKAELVDGDGFLLGDGDLTAPPVVQVIYDSGISGDLPLDVSADALPAGQGTDGNRFGFNDDSWWQFNLKTKNYEAPGTYTISMVSGDGAEYRVEPTCEAQFVIE